VSEDDEAFMAAFRDACHECIAAARRLKPRIASGDRQALIEFGRIAGTAMGKAGATEWEGAHYAERILLSALAEHQA
jgi:hypothetical protein